MNLEIGIRLQLAPTELKPGAVRIKPMMNRITCDATIHLVWSSYIEI
jgi:hypothetical protein